MQWSDERLATAPCREIASYRLRVDSTTSGEDKARAAQFKALQWFPKLNFLNAANSTIAASQFYFNETMPWLDSESPLPRQAGSVNCQNCAVYKATETITFNLDEAKFGNYLLFPFDKHSFALQFSIQDTARFYDCGGALRATPDYKTYDARTMLWQGIIMPGTAEWILETVAERAFEAVGSSPHSCLLQIRLKRDPLIFFIKRILITIVFVACGLLSLMLAPKELMGDRVTTILFSTLIVSTNMQGDTGLGNVQYITWYDGARNQSPNRNQGQRPSSKQSRAERRARGWHMPRHATETPHRV